MTRFEYHQVKSIKRIARDLFVGEPPSDPMFNSFYESFVKDINGWMNQEECNLLHQISRALTIGQTSSNFVEIGSYEGKSSVSIAYGLSPKSKLYSVDPHTGDRSQVEAGLKINTLQNFESNISASGLSSRIKTVVDYSFNASQDFARSRNSIDFLFIDGWHSREAVVEDIKSWIRFFGENVTILFDDIHDSEVKEGIKSQKKVLPPLLGLVGKIGVYTNDTRVLKSAIGRYLRRKSIFDSIKARISQS